MIITKKCIGDIKRTDTYTLAYKISYISSEDNDFVTDINHKIAENIAGYICKTEIPFEGMAGEVFALLTPYVTYSDDNIISIRYDFTVQNSRELIFHRRFCVNLLHGLEIFLLPGFLKCRGGKLKGEFYLTDSEEGLFAVPVLKNAQRGTEIKRRRDIDIYCNGKLLSVTLNIPDYLTKERIFKKRAGKRHKKNK